MAFCRKTERTLVEAARTMLSASKLPLSFGLKQLLPHAILRTKSIIISTHGKTEVSHHYDRKLQLKHLHIFGLVPQDKRRRLVKTLNPVSRQKLLIFLQQRRLIRHNNGLENFLRLFLEEYLHPAQRSCWDNNNNDQAPNASFQEAEFVNPFCTRVQEIGESSSRNIDNTDVHSFQPQSHDFRWTRDHPLEQVRGNPTMPVQTRRQLATDPEMCMFALTVSIVEPKNIKEAMADSAWIEAMQDELQVRQT
ncbi:hypothetical protein Tco_0811135 [Tanacetum coccineum]